MQLSCPTVEKAFFYLQFFLHCIPAISASSVHNMDSSGSYSSLCSLVWMMYRKFGYSGLREWCAFYSIKCFRIMLEFFADIIFAIACRLQRKGSLPDITDEVLVDGAVVLAEKIRRKQVTSLAVVQAYIKRIESVNPILRCISDHQFERALAAARDVDAVLRRPDVDLDDLKRKKPFFGVPFTVKEAVKLEGCAHTVGLHFLRNQKADRHSDAVLAMMEAGAIPIGTSTIPEMCSWWETNNPINGMTRNPYDLRYTAGGSSGGEGSAIAAGVSPMGLGTDLGGSIRIPCLFNGICGHKPTGGIVSNGGHSPELTGEMGDYFVIGPMARRMEDVRVMMEVLTKPSGLDLKFDEKVDLKELRYFFFESTGDPMIHETDDDMLGSLYRVIDHLKEAYGVSAKKVELRDLRYSFQMWGHKVTRGTMQNGDLALKSFLNDQKGDVSWLAEWAKLFVGRSNHTYPLLFHAALQGTMFSLSDSPYGRFLDDRCDSLKEEVDKLLGDDGLLIIPTFPHTALPHKKSYFYFASHGYTGFVNLLKLPATHLPVGFSKEGLPLGITIVGGRNQDALTIALACELEKTLGGYVPPCPVVLTGKGRYFSTEMNDVTMRRRGSIRAGGD